MEMLIKVSITLRNQCPYQNSKGYGEPWPTFACIQIKNLSEIFSRLFDGQATQCSHYQVGPDIPIYNLPKKLKYDEFIYSSYFQRSCSLKYLKS